MECLKWITLMFLIVVSFAGAAETFTDTYHFGRDDILRDYTLRELADNTSVSWTHILAGFDSSCTITEATLTINSRRIENVSQGRDGDKKARVKIDFMGQKLGLLAGRSTTFDLMPHQDLLQAVTDVSAEIMFRNDFRSRGFILKDAVLTIPTEPGLAPVPVPVSGINCFRHRVRLCLGALGIFLVGWLRKRSAA